MVLQQIFSCWAGIKAKEAAISSVLEILERPFNKENLNKNLGNVILNNEDAYFYLNNLNRRIEKLSDLINEHKKQKNIEKTIDNMWPPIYWKEKPIFSKQMQKWNINKLENAKKKLYETEILIKTKSNLSNNTLIKNLILDLYNNAASTSWVTWIAIQIGLRTNI